MSAISREEMLKALRKAREKAQGEAMQQRGNGESPQYFAAVAVEVLCEGLIESLDVREEPALEVAPPRAHEVCENYLCSMFGRAHKGNCDE